ncbi:hypothetical protein TR2A62_0601 [Thalassobium sp. R2A62]|nr:hypothetical protein TR2A62_0601 [Thalassobium sp. R2A62]
MRADFRPFAGELPPKHQAAAAIVPQSGAMYLVSDTCNQSE